MRKGKEYKYSIIIPMYNTEAYIGSCLQSILCQTYRNWEAIVVDDGSTDGGAAAVKAYALRNQNIRYHYQANQGLSAARNAGICAAAGDYVIFLDSDDYLCKDALENLNDAVNRCCEPDCIINSFQNLPYGCAVPQNYSFHFNESMCADLTPCAAVTGLIETQKIILCACMFTVARRMFDRHDLWFHVGIFHEDVEWVTFMLIAAETMGCNNDPLFVYRLGRPQSITSSMDIKRMRDRLDTFDLLQSKILCMGSGYREDQKELATLVSSGIIYTLAQECTLYASCQGYMEVKERIERRLYLLKAGGRRSQIMYFFFRSFGVETMSKIVCRLKKLV